jgi:hypothetical protein
MNHEEIAEKMVYPLWRCIKPDFKEKYRADAWGMFENFLKSSACQADLMKFFDQFKRLIPYDGQHNYEKSILEVLQSGQDAQILSKFRSECSYLVLLARSMNEERKEQFKNQNA